VRAPLPPPHTQSGQRKVDNKDLLVKLNLKKQRFFSQQCKGGGEDALSFCPYPIVTGLVRQFSTTTELNTKFGYTILLQ